MTGMREKRRRLVNCSVLLLSVALRLLLEESPRRPLKTARPEINSIRLSPPNASSAKLPAISPSPIDPRTSTVIHPELRYSILIPFPILPRLHDWCEVVQQQEAQLEQSATVWQFSQDVSEQPQVWQDEEGYAANAMVRRKLA